MRPAGDYTSPIGPLRPTKSDSRFSALGRVVLVVLAVAALAFAAGTRFAPQPTSPPVTPAPAPAMSAAAPASASPSPTPVVMSSPTPTATAVVLPPIGGLTLDQALSAARRVAGLPAAAVLSARVARYGDVSSASQALPGTWVWMFVFRGTFFPVTCGGFTASPQPCPAAATTARVLIDYRTGTFLEMVTPGIP
jgi:hypothetical protein